jgi:2-polyprenyl-3-methyl-5-hydroxy-6-metoxy-1,4-benzoquinol methylase
MSQTSTNQHASHANRTGYDRWATSYDDDVNSTVAADERAFPPLWSHLKGQSVLEIGCGTGRHTLKLAQAGNIVTGLDLSEGMLAQARDKLAGFAGVHLIEADITAVDLPELGLFDAAVTALVIEHLADLPRFFTRVAAHLKPGAAFFLSEIHPSRMQAGSGARFDDPETGQTTWLSSFPHTGEAVTSAAHAAGFTQMSEADYIADAAFCARHAGWEKYLNKPMVRMWVFKAAV